MLEVFWSVILLVSAIELGKNYTEEASGANWGEEEKILKRKKIGSLEARP